MSDIPKVKYESEFKMFGKSIRCYVLEDGRRMLNAEDVNNFFSADIGEEPGDVEDFTKWLHGGFPDGSGRPGRSDGDCGECK